MYILPLRDADAEPTRGEGDEDEGADVVCSFKVLSAKVSGCVGMWEVTPCGGGAVYYRGIG